ncbi:ABC transporter permease [Enterococcus sp.]|uniref:ABC transporter permease n=1 Tax=Enterococcus sp. TaxID=35783 RepID=UPI002FCB2051
MFLALNEIRHAKLRYTLVIGVMFLIAYLVFFLSGLAYGLAQENRMAVDKWQADYLLLSDKANDTLNMSMINQKQIDQVKAKEKAVLVQAPAIIYQSKDKNKKENVSFFGIDANQFIAPNIIEGKMFAKKGEVVADSSLKESKDYAIGDKIKISMNDKEMTIVGFTENAKYNVAPVLYTSLETIQEVRYGEMAGAQEIQVNAIVVRGEITEKPDVLSQITISDFINKLPGYSAQVLTFGFMIGFLVVIAAVVIGIFIYVLTMQKTAIFGVMKAQGISSGYIARSVIAQTFFLASVGVFTSLAMTILSSLVLPAAVPFQSNLIFFAGISILMIVIAIVGALFSVRTIVKIDPLKAIG